MSRTASRTSAGEHGVALLAVLAVLMALAVIATPFALSMRNQDRSAAVDVYRQKARQSIDGVLAVAEERLADTDPARDPTPHYDGVDELLVEPDFDALGTNVRNPKGSIWSARVTDQQALVDINQCSPFLLGNLLGATRLSRDIEADEDLELRVRSTDSFADQGLVWVDGEIVLYRGKTENALTDLQRGFDTSLVKSRVPATHRSGAAVLDYRTIVAAVRPYKVDQQAWHGYAAVSQLKDIARFGEVAFETAEIERIADDLTAAGQLPQSGQFVGAARAVFDFGPDDPQPEVFVNGGRNLGPGCVVRISADGPAGNRLGSIDGDVEYNLVVQADEVGDDRVRLVLQEPVSRSYRADEAIIEALARAPININTCSRRVLVALLEGVRSKGSGEVVEASEARALADLSFDARPIQGQPGFAELLRDAEQQGVISREDHLALLTNAMWAQDASLAFGTAPFVYRSYGRFRVDAAVSENLPAGREAARQFARQETQAVPAGEQVTLFAEQMDFEEAIRLSRQGKFWATFPVNLNTFDRFNQPPLRVAPYIEFERYPNLASTEEEEPFARLQPGRIEGKRDATSQGSNRVIHFDEVAIGAREFNSDEVDGWPVDELGPISLGADSELVNLLDDRGWVQPFALEMWWIPGENAADGETILFDCGEDEISNRILAFVQGGVLRFRVADATVPDSAIAGGGFGGAAAAQTPTQMAEIMFDFAEEGLPLEEDVPYHLKFYARGTKPSDMALFVDGVPRGRRAFQTRLRTGLPQPPNAGPFANVPGYTAGQGATLVVEDARLFPSYGVVRVGNELIEYTDRTDNTLVVSPGDGDAFGGRSKRGSVGDDHYQSQAVELYGYAATLHSDVVPTGSRTLQGGLGRFGVAMVNPKAAEAGSPIVWDTSNLGQGAPPSFQIGRGLTDTETTIPLVPVAKPNPGSSSSSGSLGNMFQRDGGFALIVSAPRPPPSDGADLQVGVGDGVTGEIGWREVMKTDTGALIGLGELVRYGGFDGSRLTNVVRAPTSVSSSNWSPVSNLGAGGNASDDQDRTGTAAHAHVMTWFMTDPAAQGHDNFQPIFVIPMSVSIGSGVAGLGLGNQYAIPKEVGAGLGGGGASNNSLQAATLPEMVQVGIGWSPSTGGAIGGTGTEWVRYDTIAGGSFVRDHPGRVRRVVEALARHVTADYTATGSSSPDRDALARALNFEHIAATENEIDQLAKQSGIPQSFLSQGMLAHRSVLGTEDKDHGAGTRVLPVFRTFRSGDIYGARPGARDFVTIVSPEGPTEEHRVNYSYCETDVEGWGGMSCHLAFEDGVEALFESNFAQMFSQVDPDDPGAAMNALANQNVESRDLTRILKFPSGELPTRLGQEFYLGADLQGNQSPAAMTIDEVEFFNPLTPSVNLPKFPRYIVSRDDALSDQIYLDADTLRYNLWSRGGTVIEAIDPVSNLPQDGVVLLIDDELIAISDIDIQGQEARCQVAVNGRGFLGTPIQYHPAGTAARDLTFLRVSRLQDSVDAGGNAFQLADPDDFPQFGVFQSGLELVGYTSNENGLLFMPPWIDPATGEEVGLLRGSYGTSPQAHEQGAVAYVFPYRYVDRYRPQADGPELAPLSLWVKAPGGFYEELSWHADDARELVDLVVQARVGGRGEFTDDPKTAPDVFSFVGGVSSQNPQVEDRDRHFIGRQGDDLEVRVFVRYGDGAFDPLVLEPDPGPVRGGSNDWKRAPRLKGLGVGWIGGPSRLSYEEWR